MSKCWSVGCRKISCPECERQFVMIYKRHDSLVVCGCRYSFNFEPNDSSNNVSSMTFSYAALAQRKLMSGVRVGETHLFSENRFRPLSLSLSLSQSVPVEMMSSATRRLYILLRIKFMQAKTFRSVCRHSASAVIRSQFRSRRSMGLRIYDYPME